MRKYYTATEEGQPALSEAGERRGELVDGVLEGHGPASLPEPEESERRQQAGTKQIYVSRGSIPR